jgi:hypothetical protein
LIPKLLSIRKCSKNWGEGKYNPGPQKASPSLPPFVITMAYLFGSEKDIPKDVLSLFARRDGDNQIHLKLSLSFPPILRYPALHHMAKSGLYPSSSILTSIA